MVRPGLFAFNKHNPSLQFDQIGRMQPSAIKAFIHLTDDGWWQEAMGRAPGAYGVAVDGERSDYPDLSNPVGDIEAGARELDLRPHAPRRIMGKNELLLSTNTADHWKRWLDYHIAFTVRAHQLGINVAMGALNTGHPGIGLFGDPADQWPMLDPLDGVMNDDDCWDIHEYWNASGPLACWPWTAGRFMRCPTRHKILIGECGYDEAVFAPPGTPNHGWQFKLDQAAYISQLLEYHRAIVDPRVVGTCVFLHDYDNPQWAAWDIMPVVDALVARYNELDGPTPTAMPVRIAIPVQFLRVSQTFAEHRETNKLGGWGIDFSCYTGTPVVCAYDGVVDRVEDQGVTGYGKWIQVNHGWGFTRYAHLSVQHVTKGQRVGVTQRIGLSGNTGNSTGAHLHFEVIPFSNRVWPYRVDPAHLFGGDVVPTPTPEPIPPTAIVEQEKAAARARIGDGSIAFLDKAATRLGFQWFGVEWQDRGFTYGVAQKPSTEEFYLLKVPTGQWDFAKVQVARL